MTTKPINMTDPLTICLTNDCKNACGVIFSKRLSHLIIKDARNQDARKTVRPMIRSGKYETLSPKHRNSP
jgi:hypothetical protein